MTTFEERLRNIYNRLIVLLSQFQNICVKQLNHLPNRIDTMVIGDNKIPSYVGKTIQEVTVDDLCGVIYINDNAFINCTSLTDITIPDGVTSIGSGAFINCTSLTDITIPDGVTSIGSNTFSNTGYYNDASNWENGVLYIGNHLIKALDLTDSYNIRQGTKTIALSAFQNCTSLTSVTIPDSVTSINFWAFYQCTSLTDIYLNSTTPPILNGTESIPDTTIIHVPIGSGDTYKNATNWAPHSARIVEDIALA